MKASEKGQVYRETHSLSADGSELQETVSEKKLRNDWNQFFFFLIMILIMWLDFYVDFLNRLHKLYFVDESHLYGCSGVLCEVCHFEQPCADWILCEIS